MPESQDQVQVKDHVLVSGATGLVGSALIDALSAQGHRVTRLVRGAARDAQNIVRWSATDGDSANAALQKFLAASPVDVVVHLAGAPVFSLWTAAQKKRIHDSRVIGTERLAALLANAARKPRVMVCASAIGYYGNRGDEALTEASGPGKGFLAETSIEWEAAAQPARDAGIRVVNLRIGVVLAPYGGALKAMLPAFRLGLGGKLGSGRQWMSWIALDDLLRVIEFAIAHGDISGAINAVAPTPVTNSDFSRTLARTLKRPAFFGVPEFLARMAPGGMADEALLSSERVIPDRLLRSGFQFQHSELEEALRSILKS
jgi:uncharacterized protein (TIGR01777 family)